MGQRRKSTERGVIAIRAGAQRGEPREPRAPSADAFGRLLLAHGVWVAGFVALAVGLVSLAELSSAPSFDVPIVDEATYDRLARELVGGGGLDARYFWQSPFYPLFLAGVYRVAQGSLVAARVTQAFLGALTAMATCALGRRAGGPAVGLAAALVVACFGPLLFFDHELVATAWEVLWAVSLALVSTRAREAIGTGRAKTWFAALGVVGGLSVLTRALFVPCVAALCTWLTIGQRARLRSLAPAAMLVAGLLAVLVPAAIAAREATGEARVLPYSGGINLYIGNSADSDANIRIRPGAAWDRLASMPLAHGAVTPAAREDFFFGLVLDYARRDPLGLLEGLGKKAVELASAREIPRNLDVYSYRAYSNVLAVSTWRLGRFGFPFGALFPLAIVGIALCGRALPVSIRIMLVVYPLALIAVFVTARYRAPLIPLLAIAAALGARAWWRAVNLRQWRSLLAATLLAAGGAAFAWLPGPFAAERGDYRAEMLTFVATEHLQHGRLDLAAPLLAAALASDPKDGVAHCVLGTVLTQRGDLDAAAGQFEAALALDAGDAEAHRGLGNVLVLQGASARALPHFLAALDGSSGGDAGLLNDIGQLLHASGDDEGAVLFLRRALAADPSLDLARTNLAAILAGRAPP